ncbi:MAG: SpoIIE family protein phosphatase [Holophagales bacterium]|nr:SpoIIE family protein phosphatase [Holophagales bacterium]
MPSRISGSPDPSPTAPWRNLFSLQKREAEDRRDLADQLLAWSVRNGGAPAAIYAHSDAGLELLARAGEGPFPETIPAETQVASEAGTEAPSTDTDEGSSPCAELPRGEGWVHLELPDLTAVYAVDGGSGAPSASDAAARDGLILVAAGARISQLKRQIQEHSFQAMFRGVELEALYEVGLAIGSTLDLERLGEEVLLRAMLLLDARRGALYLIDEEGCYRLTSSLGGPAEECFDPQEVDVDCLVSDQQSSPAVLLPGARHLLAVPVALDGNARGLLLVADKESRTGVGPFPGKDRRTLSLFANQAAIALENAMLHKLALEKERLEREMELAAEIQQELLPNAMPEVDGAEVLGWNRPARQVGGDYFGFQALPDGRHTLVVGDVTGKGMPAALLVSTLHSALRLLLEGMDLGPDLVERLNRHTHEASSSNKFITMILACFDPAQGRLAYLNAGHNPGVLIRADGAVEELTSGGLPLGLLPMGKYQAGELKLDPSDLVCLYSDGITECEAPDDEQFGLERLIELLAADREKPLAEIREHIDREMLAWAAGQPQGDDQTVVLLRCR